MSTYLIINILAVIVPVLLSFDKRVAFYKSWKFVFPALFITSILFVVWDIIFIRYGVWSFNSNHVGSIRFYGLPLEEILFFYTVPYSSLFIYEVLNVYIKRDFIGKSSRYVIIVIITLLLAIAVTNYDRLYTFYSFILLALTLFIMQFIFKVGYMGRFLFGYTIILIPLLIVNSILTGSFLQEPVVIYNDDENLGLKVFTIPVEDFLYGMLLILINISITEKLRNR